MSPAPAGPRLLPWALLCPRHCVRAEVDLELATPEGRVVRCSLEETLGRPCDRECLRMFLVGWEEEVPGEVRAGGQAARRERGRVPRA